LAVSARKSQDRTDLPPSNETTTGTRIWWWSQPKEDSRCHVGKKFTAEQIIGKLREAEIELSRGKKVPEMCRKIGVTEQTYYRWKKEYGGLRMDQAKRLKELEKENARLKRLLADAELDKAILREAASGNF
jgi:transposase-like protein